MEWFLDPTFWASLVTLTALEIVLGIDNVIFIALLVQVLPKHQRMHVRVIGLSLAMILRIAFLFGLAWMIGLTKPILSIFTLDFSGRDLVLLGGGLFLIIQGTLGIHEAVLGQRKQQLKTSVSSFANVILQIIAIDFVFSLDSIITAIGITKNIPVIVTAMLIAMVVMLIAAKWTSLFIEKHPTLRMLALSFILMIGTLLIADGFHFHVPRAYIYFAMLFSIVVETLNILAAERQGGDRYHSDAGFTLLECVLVLGLVSLLTTTAIPSFQGFIRSFEMESQTYAFANSLALAKSEAIKRNALVTFCAKPNCPENSKDWSKGWIVFVDNNINSKKEDSEILLYDHTVESKKISLTWNGKEVIQFNSAGSLVGFDNGTFLACAPSSQTAHSVVLNRIGRVKFDTAIRGDCPKKT